MASLSLEYFVNRAKVIAQYRSFCRVARGLDDAQRRSVVSDVRAQFERHRHEADPSQIRQLLSHGDLQLKQLSAMVSTAGPVAANHDRAAVAATPQSGNHEGDVLGRVGQAWPWSR